MFVLRKIFNDGRDANFALGRQYSFLRKELHTKEAWATTCEAYSMDKDDEKMIGIILTEDNRSFAIWGNQKNYIMTGEGSTFANVSI